MGAAFIAHFIMVLKNQDPWLEKLPERNKIATFGIGILILIIPMEYYYANYAPNSMSSSSPDPDSTWNLTAEFEFTYEEVTIDIDDGSTASFDFDVPSDVIGVMFMLNYTESNEGGFASQCDNVDSSYDAAGVPDAFTEWNLQNISGENCGENILGGFSTWNPFTQTDSYENQQSAVQNLTVVKDDGQIVFSVEVNVNTATPLNGDGGEEVTMSVRYTTLVSYDLIEAA